MGVPRFTVTVKNAQRQLELLEGRIRVAHGWESNSYLPPVLPDSRYTAELDAARANVDSARLALEESIRATRPVFAELEDAQGALQELADRYLSSGELAALGLSSEDGSAHFEPHGLEFEQLPAPAQRILGALELGTFDTAALSAADLRVLAAIDQRTPGAVADLRLELLNPELQRVLRAIPRFENAVNGDAATADSMTLDRVLRMGPVAHYFDRTGRDLRVPEGPSVVRNGGERPPPILSEDDTMVIALIETGRTDPLQAEDWLNLPPAVQAELRPGGARHRTLSAEQREDLAYLRIRAELGDDALLWRRARSRNERPPREYEIAQLSRDQYALRDPSGEAVEVLTREEAEARLRSRTLEGFATQPSAELTLLVQDPEFLRRAARLPRPEREALERLAAGDPQSMRMRADRLGPEVTELIAPDSPLFRRAVVDDPGVAASILAIHRRSPPEVIEQYFEATVLELGKMSRERRIEVARLFTRVPQMDVGTYQDFQPHMLRIAAAMENASRGRTPEEVRVLARTFLADVRTDVATGDAPIPRELGEAQVERIRRELGVPDRANIAFATVTTTNRDGSVRTRQLETHSAVCPRAPSPTNERRGALTARADRRRAAP